MSFKYYVFPFSISLRGGYMADRSDSKNPEITGKVQEVVDYSKSLGINVPKNYIESVEKSLNSNELKVEDHKEFINEIAERHQKKGYAWHVREDGDPKFPLLYYIDKHQNIDAYIVERTNNKTQEKFFFANRFNHDGKHVKISSNNDLESVKNNVAVYFTGATIREIGNERSQKLNVQPEVKTPELSM
jgi:hypothetical protein